ncbi:unnamed protein product [Phytophthora lilii]|uniref:Unnamed protein product n=1 Tax=Phytophthora lilii TaxID=2077276 RepID=A0A9W6U870_9STRA|nr:unnamed protein product [Phytophthora lilii]
MSSQAPTKPIGTTFSSLARAAKFANWKRDADQVRWFNVMDSEVDVGNGLCGTDVMMQQMIMCSTFIKTICLSMQSFDVVAAEDAVVLLRKQRRVFGSSVELLRGYSHTLWVTSALRGKIWRQQLISRA